MHSTLVRIQNLFGFFTTVAFFVGALIAASSMLFPATPEASINVRNVQVVKGRAHQYYSSKQQEYAFVKFDLEADLESLFNWNTKQVFAYITASYPGATKYNHNEAVIWDRIITSKSQSKLNLKNTRSKYNINDITGKFNEQNATLSFAYNIQPHIGALSWNALTTGELTFPPLKAKGKTGGGNY